MSERQIRGKKLWVFETHGKARNDDKNAVDLAFLHGSLAQHGQFRNQLEYFSQSPLVGRIVAWDAYGCGDSEKSEEELKRFSEEELFLDALEVLSSHIIENNKVESIFQRKLLLVGHSFGTNLCMQIAAHQSFRDNVAGLVLMGTAPYKPISTLRYYLPVAVIDYMRPSLGREFREKAFHVNTPKDIRESCLRRNSSSVIRAFYTQMRWNSSKILHLIQQPTLILVGETDGLTTVSMCQELAKKIGPLAEISIVQDSSHMLMVEQPDKVNQRIEDHIRTVLTQ